MFRTNWEDTFRSIDLSVPTPAPRRELVLPPPQSCSTPSTIATPSYQNPHLYPFFPGRRPEPPQGSMTAATALNWEIEECRFPTCEAPNGVEKVTNFRDKSFFYVSGLSDLSAVQIHNYSPSDELVRLGDNLRPSHILSCFGKGPSLTIQTTRTFALKTYGQTIRGTMTCCDEIPMTPQGLLLINQRYNMSSDYFHYSHNHATSVAL